MLAAVYRVCDAAKLYGLCQRVTPIVVYNLHVRKRRKKKKRLSLSAKVFGTFSVSFVISPSLNLKV